jgi:hypothetical protein
MFGKITKRQVNHHFNRAKDFLGNAYTHSKKFLSDIDSGVQTFKNVYSVVAPVLDSYGIKASNNQNIQKALNGYDSIRNNIMSKHDKVVNDISHVKNNLGKKIINLDF